MTRAARRTTAALLCGVVLVALGLAVVGLPGSERAPESLRVDLDFDTFVPGVAQTRTSSVDVPVASRVTDAEVVATGRAAQIDVALTICQLSDCRPLTPGLELDPGPYTLSVDALLGADAGPGSGGDLVGQIRIVETHRGAIVDTTLLMAIAGVGLVTIAFGALIARPRHGVAA